MNHLLKLISGVILICHLTACQDQVRIPMIRNLMTQTVEGVMQNYGIEPFANPSSINLGDSQVKVIKLLSEPKGREIQKSAGIEIWTYNGGKVIFLKSKVAGWRNSKKLLNIKCVQQKNKNRNNPILIDGTVTEMMQVLGTPDVLDLTTAYHFLRMEYGNNKIRHDGNKIIGYTNRNRKLNVKFPFNENCKEDFKIDLTVSAQELYACRGAPLEYSEQNSYSNWLYADCRIAIEDDEITSFEHGTIGRLNR